MPAFHEDRAEGGNATGGRGRCEKGGEKGDVLLDELLLKGDRVGGDDDLLVAFDAAEDRGDEVGEGLAHARASLDQEVCTGFHRAGDALGHEPLLRAGLKVGAQVCGDGPFSGEDGGCRP